MSRFLVLVFMLVMSPSLSWAVEAPRDQVHLVVPEILRGRFTQEHQISGATNPIVSSGRFVAAPAYGLIWSIEQPFPTSTIITPKGAGQSLGGIILKLPAKNLHHLYEMVSKALAGDWNDLEQDFTVTRDRAAGHWKMLLTPRQKDKSGLTYAKITVSGKKFVENIVMTKADGSYDALRFADQALSSTPLSTQELSAFSQIAQ